MQNNKIQWYEPQPSILEVCSVCGNAKHNKLVLQVAHWRHDLGMLDVAVCGDCHSAWFPHIQRYLVPYPDLKIILQDPDFPYYVYHYLEIVGGLDWKISLLERLPFQQFNSILEVGCNAGVMLDYCRTAWSAQTVVGLEPSAYGVIGSRLLDVPILTKFLSQADELKEKTFDFIYATEVLEHVEQPLVFLQELKQHLNPNGIMLLTTPRAGALSPSTSVGELYAALSPGAHYFLLSPEQLQVLAKQAGFDWVYIEPFGMTQMVVLAQQPVELIGYVPVAQQVLHYYQQKCQQPMQDARVQLGLQLNYYRFASELGLVPEISVTRDIECALSNLFDLDLPNADSWLSKLMQTNNLVAIGKLMPYSLPYFCYWQAKQLQGKAAASYWQLSQLMILQALKVDFQNMFVLHNLLMQVQASLQTCERTNLNPKWLALTQHLQSSIPELNAGQLTKQPIFSLLSRLKDQAQQVHTRLKRIAI